jgi:hypothetical protein
MGRIVLISVVLYITLVWTLFAHAEGLGSLNQPNISLYYDQELIRSHFSLGFEGVTIASGKASILGVGPKAGFEYGLNEKVSLGASMVFSFQGSGANIGSYFYSGISGGVRYSLVGSAVKLTDKIYQIGRSPIYSGKIIAQRRLCLNLGLEQLFLNGSTSIYPAVGTTAGVMWGGILFGYEVELDARFSNLVANDNPLSMIAFGANINLDFM